MILPDSNIWIYGIDRRAREHGDARAWFEQADEEIFLVPTLVELEVLHYIARQRRAGHTELVDDLLAFPGRSAVLDVTTVREASKGLVDHRDLGIGGRDAAVLSHALDEDATLVTHDQRLFQAAMRHGIDAHDPITVA